ncbi:hypothetical protein C6341_g4544 [Phytophthora cactorum]|nr:hypothetical protein C6341_g4544 [Phytophthora cactorum]
MTERRNLMTPVWLEAIMFLEAIGAYWASRLVAQAIKNSHTVVTVVTVVEGSMQY